MYVQKIFKNCQIVKLNDHNFFMDFETHLTFISFYSRLLSTKWLMYSNTAFLVELKWSNHNVALLSVRGVRKIFSTSDDAKRVC